MCTLLVWNNFFELSKNSNVLLISYFCLLLIFLLLLLLQLLRYNKLHN